MSVMQDVATVTSQLLLRGGKTLHWTQMAGGSNVF